MGSCGGEERSGNARNRRERGESLQSFRAGLFVDRLAPGRKRGPGADWAGFGSGRGDRGPARFVRSFEMIPRGLRLPSVTGRLACEIGPEILEITGKVEPLFSEHLRILCSCY